MAHMSLSELLHELRWIRVLNILESGAIRLLTRCDINE
jgi:hypothetical protein